MRVSHEVERGCGFRKGGGLYLMSDGIGVGCDQLPIELHVCPTCGHGVKPSRGWTWVDPNALLEGYIGPHVGELHTGYCPLGAPGRLGERCGLIWIGEQHYATPEAWLEEGRKVGFSRRIRAVPRDFKAGETWVLAAHRKAMPGGLYAKRGKEEFHFDTLDEAMEQGFEASELMIDHKHGIFHIWRPSRVEYVVKGDESEEELARIEARGIELVKVIPVLDQPELVTASGKVLTDGDIQELADEAERGYDPAQLQPLSDEERNRLRLEHGVGRGWNA